jgi:NAD(P)-dependent dehydrogenase (short-subunit alcohol dehydrogenase family)
MAMRRLPRILFVLFLLSGVGALAVPVSQAEDSPGTVLITGANRGIGLALAREYVAAGWTLVATARKPADAADLEALAAAHPGRVSIETLDVVDHASIDALATKSQGRPIDILINNAGITGNRFRQVPGKFDYPEFRQVLETNVIAPLKIADTFLPQVQASRLKKIVVISSSEGSIAEVKRPGGYFYRSSKSAVNMVMRNLALELKPRGITIVLVNPGPVDTDMMKGAPIPLQSPAEAAGRVIAVTAKATLEDTGKFWDYRGGELPW